MMRITKYSLLLLTFITAMTSCKKSFLELTSPTQLLPEQALATESDLQVALRGVYASFRAADFYGRTVPVVGDMLADNSYLSVQNTNRYTLFNNYTFNITDGNISGLWTAAYNTILRANNIINSPLTGTTNISQYKGEAYACRALAYFTLVRYFARPFTDNPTTNLGVPLITTYNPDLKPTRATVQAVYDLIVADLNNAFSMMAAATFTNSSQFSKYSAKGLLAKVYLTMGDKTNAKAAALDVIANGGFVPVTAANYVAYWQNPTIATAKGETMLEISSDAVNNLAFDALPYIYTQAGNYGDILNADALYALFATTDVRRNLYPTGVRGGVPSVFVEKYPSILADRSDTKVLRLSEMYLIAAEASLPGNELDALTYVNFITGRRNAAPIASTGAQLLEDVLTERRKELAFEGDRYMDLQRLKRDVNRNNSTGNYPPAALTLPYSDTRRLFPIPQGEINANENIRSQQNPGY